MLRLVWLYFNPRKIPMSTQNRIHKVSINQISKRLKNQQQNQLHRLQIVKIFNRMMMMDLEVFQLSMKHQMNKLQKQQKQQKQQQTNKSNKQQLLPRSYQKQLISLQIQTKKSTLLNNQNGNHKLSHNGKMLQIMTIMITQLLNNQINQLQMNILAILSLPKILNQQKHNKLSIHNIQTVMMMLRRKKLTKRQMLY